MESRRIVQSTQQWIELFVVQLNLCPFARRELERQAVRYRVSAACSSVDLLAVLEQEFEQLVRHEDIETTFLIHPLVLLDFHEYNQFLDVCDDLLVESNLAGVFQVASFHPRYQFANTQPEDPENYSNRSPFPMLHLLREDSVEDAVQKHADVDQIPQRNLVTLDNVGHERLEAMWQDCVNAE